MGWCRLGWAGAAELSWETRGEKMWGMGDTNARSIPFLSLCGVFSLSAFMVFKQWNCEFILWAWGTNTGWGSAGTRFFFAGRLRKVLDKPIISILIYCVYINILYILIYTLLIILALPRFSVLFCLFVLLSPKVTFNENGLQFWFPLCIYRREFWLNVLYFFTATYFIDCFGLCHLLCIQKSSELRKTWDFRIGI